MTSWCFSLGTPVSSTNKIDRHDIIEILLKVVLNTITSKITQNDIKRKNILLIKIVMCVIHISFSFFFNI
jgi:hypothetical protein